MSSSPKEPFDYAFSQCGVTPHLACCPFGGIPAASSFRARRGITSPRGGVPSPFWTLRCLSDETSCSWPSLIFDEFRDKDLLPAYLADADPNRALLDRRVICDFLGFDEDIYQAVRRLSAKWCAEPSVHGGKKRPQRCRAGG